MMQCVLELVAIACCLHCTPAECDACDGSHIVSESTAAAPGSFLLQANSLTGRSDGLIPRSTTRRLVQVTLGFAGSWVVGGSAYLTVYRTAGDRTVIGDEGISETANWVALGASAVGAALGTHLGSRVGKPSSVAGALAGSALATVPLLFYADDPNLPYIVFTFGTVLQTLGGILGGG
jgi:hypothetical protein